MSDHNNNQETTTPQPTKRALPIGWIVAVLLVAGVWTGAYALRGGGEKVIAEGWADGMPVGKQLAQDTDKPMIVLFTAPGWCPPCQALEKNVLTKPQVASALQADFVPVQIDLTDRSPSNPNMGTAQMYGIRSLPTLIAMTPEGELIEAYNGKHTTEGFTNWLDRLNQQ